MLYKELAGIANQIQYNQTDLDGLLQKFCLRKVADRKFLAAFYLEIERDGRLYLRAFYGALPEDVGLSAAPISVFDKHLASEAIRTSSLVWSNGSKPISGKTVNPLSNLIAWPITSEERVLGVLLALSDVPFKESDHDLEYFEALATIIGNAISRLKSGGSNGSGRRKHDNEHGPVNFTVEPDSKLTDRQEVILKLISEGRTNGDIADVLGYSESLIRQETIRIYAHLGCSGRAEAASIYKERNQEDSLVNQG